jgi:hypothetical protein
MRKTREYRGCEWNSPIYRQIVAEKQAKQAGKTIINEYKTKRGKRSSL